MTYYLLIAFDAWVLAAMVILIIACMRTRSRCEREVRALKKALSDHGIEVDPR